MPGAWEASQILLVLYVVYCDVASDVINVNGVLSPCSLFNVENIHFVFKLSSHFSALKFLSKHNLLTTRTLFSEHIIVYTNDVICMCPLKHPLVTLTCCFPLQSTYGYGDLFSDTWKAFTDYDVIHLKTYDSKKVLKTY